MWRKRTWKESSLQILLSNRDDYIYSMASVGLLSLLIDCSNFGIWVSENSVPLNPMVNDHYPY